MMKCEPGVTIGSRQGHARKRTAVDGTMPMFQRSFEAASFETPCQFVGLTFLYGAVVLHTEGRDMAAGVCVVLGAIAWNLPWYLQ